SSAKSFSRHLTKQWRKKGARPRRTNEIIPAIFLKAHNVCNSHDGSSKMAKFNAHSNSPLLHSTPSVLTPSSFSQPYARKMHNSAMRHSPTFLLSPHEIQTPTPTQSQDCRRIYSLHFFT